MAGSTTDWLQFKAEADSRMGGGDGHLWMVHGKWYDLSDFIDRHPGGPDWLRYTRGQDVTEMVETHHMNRAKVDAILRPHFVKNANDAYRPMFDWKPDGLFRTLQKRVAERLQGQTGPTLAFRIQCYAVILCHVVCFVAALYTRSILWTLAAGACLPALHGIGHNFLHQRDNWLMYCATLGGWKPYLARISHALSHHHFPNIATDDGAYKSALDMEIVGLEPWVYNMSHNIHKNSCLVWLIAFPLMATAHFRGTLQLWWDLANGTYKMRLQYLTNIVQVALFVACCGLQGLVHFFAMHLMHGLGDAVVGFPLHRTEAAWTEGDSVKRKRDFAEHIMASTVDHNVDSSPFTSLLFYELLNYHTLHHLFPALDCSRYPEVQDIFEDTLCEFGVEHKVLSLPRLFCGMWSAWG